MIRKLVLGTLLALAPAAMAAAQDLAKPTGTVILEVRGNIARTNDAGVARFDLAMPQPLGAETIATAIDDYKAEGPIADLTEKGAFLAFAADGRRLTVRDKGPLWLLYPFDARPDLKRKSISADRSGRASRAKSSEPPPMTEVDYRGEGMAAAAS